MNSAPYLVADRLFLWYLGRPQQPVLVGELNLVLSGRGVSLRYAPTWLRQGFPLSEDLPLRDIEHLPKQKDFAAGVVNDARPDRWGERVIRLFERPPRLSLLEMLYFAGDERFGALGVSTSNERYAPADIGPLPRLKEVDALHALVRKVLAGERIDERQRRLIAPGASMGGAQPKALLQIGEASWILKFTDAADSTPPLVEHAAMTLAAKAGITVAQTRPVKLAQGVAVAVRRFDRLPGRRLHALSADVALRAAGSELSYPNLAQLLRRRGATQGDENRRQMRELLRRLVFNILIDNTDDHEKNHVLLLTDAQHLQLSPAFDILPTGQALGYQAMGVGKDGAVSSVDNALSMAQAYWLTPREAAHEARQVALAVNGWQAHFKSKGVARNTIEQLATQIDRPRLLEQRQALAG